MARYNTDEGHNAVMIAMAAILNAEVEGMKALNTQRALAGMSPAYGEESFYAVSQQLRDYLDCLKEVSHG